VLREAISQHRDNAPIIGDPDYLSRVIFEGA
jgi:hypothetical protein